MVNFYVIRILLGKCTLDDVPAKYRDAVAEALKEYE